MAEPKKYQIVMASSPECYACRLQHPVFLETSEKSHHDFKFYDVSEDNWQLGDHLGIDGTPAFFIVDPELNMCIAVNNSGYLTTKEILEWIDEETK